jgi:glutamate racemase
MIEPGARFALSSTTTGRIGVIGTRATIKNKAYSTEIKRINPGVEVFEKACPLFVPLAEEGWINHKAAFDIAWEYLSDLKKLNIDTLVLGCTHYPVLANVIQKVIGENVKLVDSGIASAESVKKELDRFDLNTNKHSPGNRQYYVSDIPLKFKELAGLFLGENITDVTKVDLEVLAV